VLPPVVFDDPAAGRQPAVALGGLDHSQPHSVLHAAGWILTFQFYQNAGAAFRHEAP
jgi:hypothetical protein